MWVVVVVLAKPRMLVSVGFSFDFVFAFNNHNPIRRNQKHLTTWVHVITNSKENILYLLPAITCSYLFRVKLNFQRALESMLRKTKLNCATFRKGIYADKVSFVRIILQITPSHTIAPCQSKFAFSISNHMLCILRWYHWHSGSSRSFAVSLFAGKERVVDQAHYHRNMNLRVLDVLMPICYTTIWVTHAHKYPPRECVIRNELTEPKEYRAAKGEQFYFISFHFIFFSLGRGVRIGLAGSFVECHNKSSTEMQIVTQNTKPHSAERSFAGIMEFRTMRQKQPQKPSHMILYRTAKGTI